MNPQYNLTLNYFSTLFSFYLYMYVFLFIYVCLSIYYMYYMYYSLTIYNDNFNNIENNTIYL